MRVKEYGLSISHFTGFGWAKGKTKETSAGIRKCASRNETPDDKVFIENSGFSSSKLFKRLINKGWENKCSVKECGLSEWLGKPIRLHVDHINGNHSDNRIENLRFLCPNCHQQTATWGNKVYNSTRASGVIAAAVALEATP